MNPLQTHALDCLTTAINLILQGSLCDAREVIQQVQLPDGAPLADLMARMLELIDRLTGELSSKESVLATVQTAMWELEAAQENLRANEARFRTTLESIGDGLISTDVHGRVDFMNPVAERLTGWAAKEASGQPIGDVFRIVNTQTRAEAENPAGRVLHEGVVVGVADHTLLIARDGTERQIADSRAPIRDAGEQILGAVLVFRDVTEEYRRREQLQESEERHRVLFESSRDAIMIMAPPSWKFTSGNLAALEMFGVTNEAGFTTLHLGDMSPTLQPDGRPSAEKAREATEKALREGSNFFPWTYKRANGDVFNANVLLARTRLRGKTILQATVRDVSEQQRLEAELSHARKLEAVGQLAAGIAHEINTPAQYVGDSIHFLADSFQDAQGLIARYREEVAELPPSIEHEALRKRVTEAEQAAGLEYIQENAPAAFARALDGISRVSIIVSAMKEFAHPDRREKSPADLNRALQATLTIARNEYKYVADVETELGQLPLVLCHLGDLSQVFLNLLVNAAHAIADAEGTSGNRGRIRVRTAHEGDKVRIDIADTGCGIPEKIRDRVFEPFFTTKEVGRGSGQGLAIARSVVVDKHGGTLTYESEVGKGTTFIIRLPIDGSSAAPAVPASSVEVIR
ncbi:MAG: PAS domain S-box protein [Acidobacteria bacterium]|nr:PAS domain S-box protein [Acidobacteriota bacterium]